MNLSEKLLESLGRSTTDEPTLDRNYTQQAWQFNIPKGFVEIPVRFPGIKAVKLEDKNLKNNHAALKSIISYINFDMKEITFKVKGKKVTQIDGYPVSRFVEKIVKIVSENPDMETYDFMQAVKKEFK